MEDLFALFELGKNLTVKFWWQENEERKEEKKIGGVETKYHTAYVL